ncbi:Scr1 family TA system antitoxin-like transcriptional regulator [Streptomyces sp. NPDC056910]|uniref:Scr1 family TA system antitoxin-like transcriptional regulator n=1 Tax=Streptomyces sp. NPDC056910 TaxID=3345964 RepID=UPI0036823160
MRGCECLSHARRSSQGPRPPLVTRPDLMRLRLWKLLERPTVIAHEEPHSGPLKTAEVAAAQERGDITGQMQAADVLAMVLAVAQAWFWAADDDAMAAQLGYLLTAGALPAVSLGIIPMNTPARGQWPQEVFHVYDDTLVSVELLSAQVSVTQPSEIALYLRAFEQLRSMAVYGADARSLIVKAIDALG